MNKLSRCHPARLAVSGVVIPMAVACALAGCGGSSPAASSPATSATSRAPAHSATSPTTGAAAPSVTVPKYVAAENARKDVAASSCKHDGAKGWLLKGTLTNSSSSARSYSIVIDFVSSKGDTVLDTKVVRVRRVAPKASAHWSAIGAAGQANVTCVIRQALGRA
ncbi:MAG: hypothetical protein ABSB01_14355 [Streptosporangiaceae bacterium]